MDAKMITLIANGVLLVFMIFGFLFGLKGIRKSGLSLAFFIGALIYVYFENSINTILHLKSHHLWAPFALWCHLIPVNVALLHFPSFGLTRGQNPSQI